MPKIALLNLLIGFIIIFLASCGGYFVATDAERSFLLDPEFLKSWQYTLQKSAHGHFNLYGILHILVGLSFPYSNISLRMKKLQTVGLVLGSFAMGGLLTTRAFLKIGLNQIDALGIVIGICLASSLLAILVHIYGLSLKLFRK